MRVGYGVTHQWYGLPLDRGRGPTDSGDSRVPLMTTSEYGPTPVPYSPRYEVLAWSLGVRFPVGRAGFHAHQAANFRSRVPHVRGAGLRRFGEGRLMKLTQFWGSRRLEREQDA